MTSGISLITGYGLDDCCKEQQSLDVANSPFTALASYQYFVDSSGGAITINLPSAPLDGDTVEVYDSEGQFATNNVTVSGNGNNIAGVASEVLDEAYSSSLYIYSAQSGQWVKLSGSGGGLLTAVENGLTLNGSVAELGGELTKTTTIDLQGYILNFVDLNGVLQTLTIGNDGSRQYIRAGGSGGAFIRLTGAGLDFSNGVDTTILEYISDGVESNFEYGAKRIAEALTDTLANIQVLESFSSIEVGRLYFETTGKRYGYGNETNEVIWFDEIQNSGVTVISDLKRTSLSGYDLTIPYSTTDLPLNLTTLTTVSNTLGSTLNLGAGQITLPEAGNYKISVYAETNSNNDVWAEVSMLVGGIELLKVRTIGDSGTTLIKTGTAVGVFALNAGDVLEFTRDASDGNGFDAVNIDIELVDQTIIDGFNFLTNLTPSSETLTGETFNNKPVYRRRLQVGSLNNGGFWSLGAEDLIRTGGYITDSTGAKYTFPFSNGTDEAFLTLESGNTAATVNAAGDFLGNPYHIFADYTKP